MTEEFGAVGAAVFDSGGPVAARPVRVAPSLILGLGAAREGISESTGPGTHGGLTIMSHPIRDSGGMRIAAAWSLATGPWDELRTMAAILAGWLENPEHRRVRSELRPGRETRRLDRESFITLVDTIPAIVYIAEMGGDGRWRYVSPQIEIMFGYTPEEWMDDPTLWRRSIHPDDLEHALSFEDERLIGIDLHPPAEYRMRTRDGRYLWVYERARLIRLADGAMIWHGVMQDITARKAAEFDLARKADQQALVAELGKMAVRGEDPDHLLAVAVDRIAELDQVIAASVWELENRDRLHVIHRSDDLGDAVTIPFDAGEYPGRKLLRGEPVFVPSWKSDDPRLDVYREYVPAEAISSFAAPILGPGDGFGLVLVHSAESAAFTEDDGNFLTGVAGVLGNAIQRSRADRSLLHRLNHDVLTELPNRRLFETRLREAISEAERRNTTVALIFLDIDHFKLINDGIGHTAGDEVLRLIAPRLSRGVRRGDTVSRFGGDEFGIILHSVAGPDEAVEIARRILDSVAEPMRIEDTERRITASVGISTWRPDGNDKTPEDLIQEADAAMYDAKESGRAQVQVFDGAIQEKVIQRLEVERELHTAISQGELTVLYQPIIGLEEGRLCGFEALVRWEHPVKGLLKPGDFIPIAEESELIREIDTWVLRQAVGSLADWNRGRSEDRAIGVSVNCSARQIGSRDLPGLVSKLIEEQGIRPGLLTFELTETTLLSGSRQVSSVIEQLDRLGVRLSLDDFGTGFSSLGYLGEFPLDEIKIDRKFIDLVSDGDPRGSAIVGAVVQIGEALSMNVVAEAVNTNSTLGSIRELGCHRAQGYMIGEPAKPAEAAGLAARRDPLYRV